MEKVLDKAEILPRKHTGGIHPNCQFPKGYQNININSLNFDPNLLEKLHGWVNGYKNFIVFLGRAGCGKTHFCSAMADLIWNKDITKFYPSHKEYKLENNEYIVTNSTPCWEEIVHKHIKYFNVRNLFLEFKKLYEKGKGDSELKAAFQKVDYLLIDDLGATSNTTWQTEVIYDILDERYANGRPTIITSNFTFDKIEEIFHQRIRSRLEDVRNLLIFDWETDYRLFKEADRGK